MLDPQELARTTSAFGVAEEQVRRDHLISHLLAALAALDVPVVFFGGTALARTWLTDPANGGCRPKTGVGILALSGACLSSPRAR